MAKESTLMTSTAIVLILLPKPEDDEPDAPTQVPRAFVVLRPGIEETEENLTNLMESRLEVCSTVTMGNFTLYMYWVNRLLEDRFLPIGSKVNILWQSLHDSQPGSPTLYYCCGKFWEN